jgi:hypothetical protein
MAYPVLTPASNSSKSILPQTGSILNVVTGTLPFGVYVNPKYWSTSQINLYKQGSAEQVAFVYRKLGGDVLDIEIVENQVHAAYEEACLEYSYLLNIHQTKNSLGRALGSKTGSFDDKGQLTGSDISGDQHLELKYPKFSLGYAQRVGQGYSQIASLNGTEPIYSASFDIKPGVQDYDLQATLMASPQYSGTVANKRVLIKRVFYKTTAASWNFYGYFGGLNVVGNLSTYGQYADDSTFEIVPVWQNKLQAMAYEDAIKTRVSDYSYQIRNNTIRIFPVPSTSGPIKFWFEFQLPTDPFSDQVDNVTDAQTDGINNMNSIPFQNIPYDKINSIGKQWIRRFCLSLCKEMLGQIRSKFSTIPIPGETVTLNGTALVTEAKAEQTALRDELIKVLDETTYDKLLERDVAITENSLKIQSPIPNLIYVG